MKEEIRQRALRLGFDECGVTTARPPESATHFRQWLAQGRQGEMSYLERNAEKRVDPQKVLPGARSIIVVAVAYSGERAGVQQPDNSRSTGVGRGASSVDRLSVSRLRTSTETQHAPPGTTGGFIARYARFEDYHRVIGGRLKELAEFVNEIGGNGTRSLWYVDTGPLLERDLGQRAGLGFTGKHTNLISRRLGNWFFLSEIITTLELESDAPEKNRCGHCVRCLEACPTQAITAPFQLDARRCISYLTIELKGSIPVELRPAIGNRIYGCDDCLAVCPWNRFAQVGRLMNRYARDDLAIPELLELLSLDEAGFKQRFAGTPMLRARRRGLLRNVCVALGNVGDATALPPLERAVRDAEPLIAEHAQWALTRIRERLAENHGNSSWESAEGGSRGPNCVPNNNIEG